MRIINGIFFLRFVVCPFPVRFHVSFAFVPHRSVAGFLAVAGVRLLHTSHNVQCVVHITIWSDCVLDTWMCLCAPHIFERICGIGPTMAFFVWLMPSQRVAGCRLDQFTLTQRNNRFSILHFVRHRTKAFHASALLLILLIMALLLLTLRDI